MRETKIDPVVLCEALELLVDKRREARDDVVAAIAEGAAFAGELDAATQRLDQARAVLDSVWIKPRERGYAGVILE